MKVSTIFFGIVVLFSALLNAQNEQQFKDILSETEAHYKNSRSYLLEATYQLFEAGSDTPSEDLEGIIQKIGNDYYSKIGETEQLYIGNKFLKINHQEKAVLYKKTEGQKSFSPVDVVSMLAYFENIEVQHTESNYVCELTFMDSENLPYDKMLLIIDATSYEIKKQELFFKPHKRPMSQSSSSEILDGRLVITLERKSTPKNKNIFNISNYISDDKNPTLVGNLANYELYNTIR